MLVYMRSTWKVRRRRMSLKCIKNKPKNYDTPSVIVQAIVQALVQISYSNSNHFSILKLSPNATCKGSSNFCIQVMSSKFIFLKIMTRENFGELFKLFSKDLMPLKIQMKFKSCLLHEFVIQNPYGN
jgi:hypothetical protein